MSKHQDWPIPDSEGYRKLTGSSLTESELDFPANTWGLFLKDFNPSEPVRISHLQELIELRCERSLPSVIPVHDGLHRLRLRYEKIFDLLSFKELEYLDAKMCDIDLSYIADGCPEVHSLSFYACNVRASSSWSADRVVIECQPNEDWDWLKMASDINSISVKGVHVPPPEFLFSVPSLKIVSLPGTLIGKYDFDIARDRGIVVLLGRKRLRVT